MKLTKKAADYLKKYQSGDIMPGVSMYQNPQDFVGPTQPYQNIPRLPQVNSQVTSLNSLMGRPLPTVPSGWNQNELNNAYASMFDGQFQDNTSYNLDINPTTVNSLPTSPQMATVKNPMKPAQGKEKLKIDAGMFSPAVNLAMGAVELIKAGKNKKRQKGYDKLLKQDLKERQEQARTADYYYTPYMQQGGWFESTQQYLNEGIDNATNFFKDVKQEGNKIYDATSTIERDPLDPYGWKKFGKQVYNSSGKVMSYFPETKQAIVSTGASIMRPFMQQGGGFANEMDQFMQYYSGQEQANDKSFQAAQDWYNQENQRKLMEWKNQQQAGIGNMISGAAGIASTLVGAAMKDGGIHINPANKGVFTAKAAKRGLDVQEFARKVLANKSSYDPKTVKQANFARNATKFKHQEGGTMPSPFMPKDSTVWDTLYNQPLSDSSNNSNLKYSRTPEQLEFEISQLPKSKQDYINNMAEISATNYQKAGRESNSLKSHAKVRFREKQSGGLINGQPFAAIDYNFPRHVAQQGGLMELLDPTMPRSFQDGAEYDPTMDLYSAEFDADKYMGRTPVDPAIAQAEADLEQMEIAQSSALGDWIFEDNSDVYGDILSDSYSGSSGVQEQLPIEPILGKLKSMGITPSSTTGGQHNTGSAHYHGKAIDLGLNTSFGGDTKKMQQFMDYLNTPEGKQQFPNVKVRDERMRPAGQKVWSGSHLHLEID